VAVKSLGELRRRHLSGTTSRGWSQCARKSRKKERGCDRAEAGVTQGAGAGEQAGAEPAASRSLRAHGGQRPAQGTEPQPQPPPAIRGLLPGGGNPGQRG